MAEAIIRVMGESDVHYVTIAKDSPRKPVSHLETLEDKVNWLGHMMDADRFAQISDSDLADLEAVTEEISSEIRATQNGNFTMMVVLREKWPVGSKAKFKVKAERVSAAHTYKLVYCPAQQIEDLSNEEALQNAELQALGAQVPVFKKAKKLFANSSAIHGFLKQAGA